jgi:hypothetical protein
MGYVLCICGVYGVLRMIQDGIYIAASGLERRDH